MRSIVDNDVPWSKIEERRYHGFKAAIGYQWAALRDETINIIFRRGSVVFLGYS